MSYVLPRPLTKGDTIGVIAPSGPVGDKEPLLRAKAFFEKSGYNVEFSEHLFEQDRYLSSLDEHRVADIHWAFSNKNIDTIICARGGYGALRLIDKIDYDLIKANPKNFCGYSDITILSAMFLKKADLITYSAPMMKGDFGAEKRDDYTINSFFIALNNEKQVLDGQIIYDGTSKGVLWGGNLASLVSLCGVDFIPDREFIFFAEDLNEPVYKIDKMLAQLFNIEKFRKNIKGMAFGQFLDCGCPEQLEFLFKEISNEYNLPTLSGLKISHEDTKATIPYGKECELNSNKIFV